MSRSPLRSAIGGLILAFLAVSAVYSGGFFGLRDALPPPGHEGGHGDRAGIGRLHKHVVGGDAGQRTPVTALVATGGDLLG